MKPPSLIFQLTPRPTGEAERRVLELFKAIAKEEKYHFAREVVATDAEDRVYEMKKSSNQPNRAER